MSHEFEVHKEISLEATPEQVWDAIATGPGADSWFMGRSDIEPRQGGATRLTVGDQTEHATVAAWEPSRRLVIRVGGDGQPAMAIEYLIEGRDGASTVLHVVQNGVLGDDWETEYEAMGIGWDMYLQTLASYLRHFNGRYGLPVTAMRPGAGEQAVTWPVLLGRLGLVNGAALGSAAQVGVPASGQDAGVVDYLGPGILGIRSDDALYRFMHTGASRGNVLFLAHHLFGQVDAEGAEQAWQHWLDDVAEASTTEAIPAR